MHITNYTETHHTGWNHLSEEDRETVLDMLSKRDQPVVVNITTSGVWEGNGKVESIDKEITIKVRIPIKKVTQ